MIKTIILLMPLILYLWMLFIVMSPSKKTDLHPMSFMMMLIFMTLMITINIHTLLSSWIPYMLFLTMIGGLLIIYMYIVSLINNELFYLDKKIMMINILKISLMTILILSAMIMFKEYNYLNMNSISWNNFYIFMNDQNNMNFMYKKFFNKSTIFIMLYLYYSMICIMNICLNFSKPLRQLTY